MNVFDRRTPPLNGYLQMDDHIRGTSASTTSASTIPNVNGGTAAEDAAVRRRQEDFVRSVNRNNSYKFIAVNKNNCNNDNISCPMQTLRHYFNGRIGPHAL